MTQNAASATTHRLCRRKDTWRFEGSMSLVTTASPRRDPGRPAGVLLFPFCWDMPGCCTFGGRRHRQQVRGQRRRALAAVEAAPRALVNLVVRAAVTFPQARLIILMILRPRRAGPRGQSGQSMPPPRWRWRAVRCSRWESGHSPVILPAGWAPSGCAGPCRGVASIL